MKTKLFVLGIVLVLVLLAACVQQQDHKKITVLFEDKETDMILKSGVGCVALTEMVNKMEVKNLENHVFELIGDKTSTITYPELEAGCFDEETWSLQFTELMCECSDIKNLNTIKIKKAVKITKGEETWFATIDAKQFIEGYITDTPEAYLYTADGEETTFDVLPENAYIIEIKKPEESIEFKLMGDNPSQLFTEGSVKEMARGFLSNENDYVYLIDGEELAFDDLPISADYIEFARRRIYVKKSMTTNSKIVSIYQDTMLKDITSVKNPETYDYKLISSDGFSPAPLSWTDFRKGIWDASEQITVFEDLESKKYSIRDLQIIELVQPSEETHEENEILIANHINDLERTEIWNSEAVLLADFITVENPESYTYQLIASDGFSPEPFTWDDMNNGYWLLDIEETLFPDKNFGTNRIRDLEKIVLIS
ncbi:MAG: hypothetical protein ABIE94_02790 [archaeon]